MWLRSIHGPKPPGKVGSKGYGERIDGVDAQSTCRRTTTTTSLVPAIAGHGKVEVGMTSRTEHRIGTNLGVDFSESVRCASTTFDRIFTLEHRERL